MQLITPTKPLLAGLMLLAATQVHATLTNYTADGQEVVYSSVSDVTWTKDANLLGSMFASQGFDKVVNAIIAASPTVTSTPNDIFPSGIYTLTSSDFSNNGLTTWFGAMAYVSYLNSISYGGSTKWYLPIVANTTIGFNTPTNGTIKGDELMELYYGELNGTADNNIPNTPTFDNEQVMAYWSGTEYAPSRSGAWRFDTEDGDQDRNAKSNQIYVWAVSPGQIATVPEPESIAMLLAGLSVVGGVMRRRHC